MSSGIILCVDDESSILVALRAVLSKLGSNILVEIAEDGNEALEIIHDLNARKQNLAVVISDFIMPGVRGDDLLIQIHQTNPDAIKIMLTGQSDFEGVKKAINHANLYRFLEKPFNNDDILLTVRSAFQAHKQDCELKLQNVQLHKLNHELEAMLEMLNKKNDELTMSEAKATISTLVASVSHELGTPLSNSLISIESLTVIISQAQTLMNSGKLRRSDLDEFFTDALAGGTVVENNLKRASTLLQNLKTVAADQASEQRRFFGLATMMDEILSTMAPSIGRKPHKVVCDVPANITLDSRPGALGQVVINIINNAYLHAFEEISNGILHISAKQIGNAEDGEAQVEIVFSDNGVGISPENLARLTEAFFSTKIGRGGTGLGMSIVENLVCKALKGKLAVESTVGVGTKFSITLPCVLPG